MEALSLALIRIVNGWSLEQKYANFNQSMSTHALFFANCCKQVVLRVNSRTVKNKDVKTLLYKIGIEEYSLSQKL